jgi:hypothetical protein
MEKVCISALKEEREKSTQREKWKASLERKKRGAAWEENEKRLLRTAMVMGRIVFFFPFL